MNYWESYQRISSKLKKRFMRKPNQNEAAEEFEDLLRALNRNGIHQYAAFCCLAVARCEQAMTNTLAEAHLYVEAGRLFWDSELESQTYQFSADGSCFGYEEHLVEAIDCYLLAIECYSKLSHMLMCAQLYIELANMLKALKKFTEAIIYYEKSVEIMTHHSLGVLLALQSLHCAICCHIELRNLTGAIDSLTQAINLASKERAKKQTSFTNHSSDYLRQTILDFEMARIMLMLLEQFDYAQIELEFYRVSSFPPPAEIKLDSLSPFVRKIPIVNETVVHLDPDTSALLQSVMVAFRKSDLKALAHLESMLWLDSPPLQREIFHLLVASKDSHTY